MDAYVAAAVTACRDPASRAAQAAGLRQAVLALHCGEAWDAHLAGLRDVIPSEHVVGFAYEPPRLPEELARYRARIGSAGKAGGPLAFAQKTAAENQLHARSDIELLDALRRAAA